MKERAKAFWTGIFVIAALIVAFWLMLFIRPSLGDGKEILRVRFTNIEKISVGTRVTFAGKLVGEVVAINEIFDARSNPPDASGNIYFYELILRVDSSVHIYSSDQIIFSSSGLLGERTIAIIPKAPKPGVPAREITNNILYARSTDPFTDALTQLSEVSVSFDKTLSKINTLIDDSVTPAIDEIQLFFGYANEKKLPYKLCDTLDIAKQAFTKADSVFNQAIEHGLIKQTKTTLDQLDQTLIPYKDIGNQISKGEGTLGRLLYNDAIYLQLSGTLGRLQLLMSDINNYGLLFQYDKKWQRMQSYRRAKLNELCTPCDFYTLFTEELSRVSSSVCAVSSALETAECREIPLGDPCFDEQLRLFIERIETLYQTVQLYRQKLSQDYYQKCYH